MNYSKGRIITTHSKTVIMVILLMLISSCGFNLRGSQALPDSLKHVLINAPLQYSPLSRALQQRLSVYQLNGIINESSADPIENIEQTVLVRLQPEHFERRLLSVFTSGQVAEYELVYSVNYQVVFPNALPINNKLTVNREYQDDPDQILAKSRELDLILNELRSEAADRLIRLLSSQYSAAIIDTSVKPSAKKRNKGN